MSAKGSCDEECCLRRVGLGHGGGTQGSDGAEYKWFRVGVYVHCLIIILGCLLNVVSLFEHLFASLHCVCSSYSYSLVL